MKLRTHSTEETVVVTHEAVKACEAETVMFAGVANNHWTSQDIVDTQRGQESHLFTYS